MTAFTGKINLVISSLKSTKLVVYMDTSVIRLKASLVENLVLYVEKMNGNSQIIKDIKFWVLSGLSGRLP
jgi:hypothetical protein